MASAPDTLTLKTHRDHGARSRFIWVRRVLLGVLGAFLLLALLNQFGQRPVTTTATSARAKLLVYAPVRARSGLVYAARFRVDAIHELKDATLVLWPGWAEAYTVNGLSPQPLSEGSKDGKIVFTFGHVAAGDHLTFWLSLQVNPTNVGHRSQRVDLYDGKRLIDTIDRSITVFP